MIIIGTGVTLPDVDQPLSKDHPIVGWHSVLSISSVSATFDTAGTPIANVVNPSTALYWVGNTSGSVQYVTWQSTSAEALDYLAFAKHNFGTAGLTFKVQGASTLDIDDDPVWTDLTSTISPDDDSPLLVRFVADDYYGIRLAIDAADVAPRIAVLNIGELLVLQRKIYVGHSPMAYNDRVNVTSGFSESGQFLGRIILQQVSQSQIAQQNITPAYFRGYIEPWRQSMKRRPFFFAWRPFSYNEEINFCAAAGDVGMSNQLPNGMVQFTVNVQGVV